LHPQGNDKPIGFQSGTDRLNGSTTNDFESYNPAVLIFVSTYRGKTSVQIRADAAWQKAQAKRPKHFDEMTQAD